MRNCNTLFSPVTFVGFLFSLLVWSLFCAARATCCYASSVTLGYNRHTTKDWGLKKKKETNKQKQTYKQTNKKQTNKQTKQNKTKQTNKKTKKETKLHRIFQQLFLFCFAYCMVLCLRMMFPKSYKTTG